MLTLHPAHHFGLGGVFGTHKGTHIVRQKVAQCHSVILVYTGEEGAEGFIHKFALLLLHGVQVDAVHTLTGLSQMTALGMLGHIQTIGS